MPSSRYAAAGDYMLSRSQWGRSDLVHLVVDNETAGGPGHTACSTRGVPFRGRGDGRPHVLSARRDH